MNRWRILQLNNKTKTIKNTSELVHPIVPMKTWRASVGNLRTRRILGPGRSGRRPLEHVRNSQRLALYICVSSLTHLFLSSLISLTHMIVSCFDAPIEYLSHGKYKVQSYKWNYWVSTTFGKTNNRYLSVDRHFAFSVLLRLSNMYLYIYIYTLCV